MSSSTEKLNSIKIPLEDIKEATNNFSEENLIRHVGKRKIYKGELSRFEKSINIVAVCFDPTSWRRRKEFMKEITMLCSLKHPNLASIVGFCDEKIIVYKLYSKRSLDQHISDPVTLTWTQRLRICLGIARALSYINYDKERNFSVIHGNVKSSKILLDDKWQPKVFGFELSKVQPAARRQGLVLDRLVSGTVAYVDPAYVRLGGVTHKSDVYSFGVVLFEVLCGMKAFVQAEKQYELVNMQGSPSMSVTQARPPSIGDNDHHSRPAISSGDNDYNLESDNDYDPEPEEFGISLVNKTFKFFSPALYFSSDELSDTDEEAIMQTSNSTEKQPIMSHKHLLGYDFSEAEEYLITLKSLEGLHIPEDGLLAKLAKSHYENETLDDIIHPDLRKQMDSRSLKKFSEAAYCCLNEQRAQRPNIDRVIFALEQALELQIAHENSEHRMLAVKGKSTYHLKGKDFEHLKIGLDAIKKATENFDKKYCIGSGGYGVVYKAELEHFDPSKDKDNEKSELPKKRSMVAIKHIIKSEDTLQAEQGFIAEIETLSSCKHPNIVSLLGFCREDSHMILVYELVSNGSLDDYLGMEGKMTNLTWVQRIKICIDIACGLNYIHTTMDKNQKIIHRDIKSANILLGDNFEAKIADFGLSRLHSLNHKKSTIVTNTVAGTSVYLDPEYESTGHLKKESDVYSFGVVLFELLTGRLAYDLAYINENEKGLAPIVRHHFKSKGTLKDMLDPKLQEESDGKGFSLCKGPNKDSLYMFSKIGYQCLSEKQEHRPTMKAVIKELEEALKCQEAHKDGLRISFEDIQRATQHFNHENIIGKGGFGTVYTGEILLDNEPTPIVAKRNEKRYGQGEQEFLTELEILFEYKHENVISLVGYCDENNERVSVFEYASNGSLDTQLANPHLTWTKRLKIGIDVAMGLHFLHGDHGSQQAAVIHRDITSANILLTSGWKAKIADFGLSIITAIDNDINLMVDDTYSTPGYIDPQFVEDGFFTRESDIYSLGVVLFEIMSGRKTFLRGRENLVHKVKRHYEIGKLNELVFKDINNMIVPASLTAYLSIAYECLHNEREKRPTASNVVSKLKEALRFQEDIEIWKEKLPKDYKEIIQMSKTPETYSNVSNIELCELLSEGILLKKGKAFLSVNSNGERNEMVSATIFSYENKRLHKPISNENSRFKRVVKIMDIYNLKIQIKIRTQLLSPNVIYGAHLVFKFCEPKFSSKLMYVNLKYKMGGETLHAYFATRGDDEWMMIELCRFIPYKKVVNFKVLLESFSRYYCGSGGIFVEGIHFRAIHNANATLKVKPNSDYVQQVSVDYDEITQLKDDEKLFSPIKSYKKKCQMLRAKMVLYESSNVNYFKWKFSDVPKSRFLEVGELLSHQVFRIKCKIKTQKLSPHRQYASYLVFKLSEKCCGLQCPVKVRDVLLRKNKEFKFIYFRSPRVVNLHSI